MKNGVYLDMRLGFFLALIFVVQTLSGQTPPAHTYFDSPLIIEDGADIIDSTDHALSDTVPELNLNGNRSGNWYRLVGDGYYYTHFVREIINSGAFTSREMDIVNGEIIPLSNWEGNQIIKMEPGLIKQYYIAPALNTERLIYNLRRKDYIANNPYDEISNAGTLELDDCVDASTFLATPSNASQSFVQFPGADVFYKFTATSEATFHPTTVKYPRYEIFTDLSQSDFEKIKWEQNDFGYKYSLELDSIYYIRFSNYDPFDESIQQFCMEVYDPEIHDEDDNFICEDARTISFDGSGAIMFIDTFASSISTIENCNDPQLSMGQWYHLEERDTTMNYTIYADTAVLKIHAFGGDCGALECYDGFYIDNNFSFYSIKFTLKKEKSLFFYVENLNQEDLNRSVYIVGSPSGKAEICDDAISVESDTTLSIDFSDAVHTFNSCTNEKIADKWITLKGDGRRVVITNRSNISYMHVYEGSCDSLACIMVSYNASEYIETEIGKEYKIGVTNPYYATANIELDIRYLDPPINETYEAAILLSCGDTISRNFDAVAQGYLCINATMLWYELPPSESIYNIVISPPEFRLGGTIFTETSNGINCEGLFGIQESMNISVNEGEKKYLGISHNSPNSSFTPTFQLTIGCSEPAMNDEVEGALNIACEDTLAMSALNASPSNVSCFYYSSNPDLWYRVIGDDKIYTALSTGGTSNFLSFYNEINGTYDCYSESSYASQNDTLNLYARPFGNWQDTTMFTITCESMASNRSADLSETTLCGERESVNFRLYQDSLSVATGLADAWFSIHPSEQVLSFNKNGHSSVLIRIYRKVNEGIEEISYDDLDHIELPDTTSEYLIQFISSNVRREFWFEVTCLKTAPNSSICTTIELNCQDTFMLDGNLRVLTSSACNEPGLPNGYWYQLNGSHRGMLTSINSYIRNPFIIGKDELGYDTVEVNYGYVEMEFVYFDLEEGKDYYLVFPEGTRSQQVYYECLSNVVSNSSDQPAPYTEWQSCNQERYFLSEEDSFEPGDALCDYQYNNGSYYWFEYISSPDGTVDLEISHFYSYYHLELYDTDGSPISCLSPISSTDDYPYYTDRYLHENLVSNKRYLLKVVNQDIDFLFSICSSYECNDYNASLAYESELVMCPEVVQRASIPSHTVGLSYSINSNSLIDSIDQNNVYFKYNSGFEKDTAILMIENHCGETYEKRYSISESSPSFCSFSDCGRNSIFIDDELLNTGLIPSSIKVREKIQGQFNLSSQDLYLQAGEEVILFPGTSVSDQTLLKVSIKECVED